jgi:hypothetical protein
MTLRPGEEGQGGMHVHMHCPQAPHVPYACPPLTTMAQLMMVTPASVPEWVAPHVPYALVQNPPCHQIHLPNGQRMNPKSRVMTYTIAAPLTIKLALHKGCKVGVPVGCKCTLNPKP